MQRRLLRGALQVWIAGALLALGSACGGSGRALATPQPDAVGGDTALFAAVVARIVADARGVPVRVDPRPLRPDPAIVELVPRLARAVPDFVRTPPDPLAPVSRWMLRQRAAVLGRLHIPGGDAFAFDSCPGILVPPELQANRPPVAGCPPQPFSVAIVGLPRPGGAYWPGSTVDQRATAGEGAWSARVIERYLSPTGGSATARDYVLRRDPDGRWRIVAVVPLMITE